MRVHKRLPVRPSFSSNVLVKAFLSEDMELYKVNNYRRNIIMDPVYANPFTPAKSDQFQISPAASPEIFHHTASRLLISYSKLKILIPKIGRMSSLIS